MNEQAAETGGGDLTLLSREELQARIRERTAYLEDVMNTMVDVLLRTDADGRIEMANDAVADVLGYEPEEAIGKPIDVVFASPDHNEQLSEMFDSGAFVQRLLADGQLADVEIYFETADGEVIPMSVSASVTTDSEGSVTGIVCVAKDISERKEAEETAQFLHSLLRHDLGNKLQVTQGYLEMLRDGDLDDDEIEYIENALGGVDDANELIENVRMLERAEGDEEQKPMSIAAVLERTVERTEGLASQLGITIATDLEDVSVRGGPLMTELFVNLVENACKHSGGSRVEVRAERTDDGAVVTVADDGTGIPPEDREQIFVKGHSGGGSTGSGLGMYLVAQLTENYGGEITVGESALGGARFDVHLQCVD